MPVRYESIMLPIDGSQQSIDAFKKGIELAKGWNSKVYLVRVIADNSTVAKDDKQTIVDSLLDYSVNEGVSIVNELVYGDPRTNIANDLVKKWNIDLIVMGATGKGRIRKLLIGSITDYVIRNAKCDVLVIR